MANNIFLASNKNNNPIKNIVKTEYKNSNIATETEIILLFINSNEDIVIKKHPAIKKLSTG